MASPGRQLCQCDSGAIKVLKHLSDLEIAVMIGNSKLVAKELVKAASELVKAATELVDSLGKFGKSVTTLIEGAIEKLNTLKHNKIDFKYKAKSIKEDMINVLTHTLAYLDSLDTLISYSCDGDQKQYVEEGLSQSDLGPLRCFLDLLQTSMTRVRERFADFEGVCKTAKENGLEAARECEHKSTDAKGKKIATRAVGGTIAAVGLAGGVGAVVTGVGVAASVVAGFFTFGIGTAAGLVLTAAGSAAASSAVGAGTAAATHFVARHYKATEKQFAELADIFEALYNLGSMTHMQISNVDIKVKALKDVLEDMQKPSESDDSTQIISCLVNHLFEKFAELHKVTPPCKEEIEKIRDKITEL